MYQVRQNSGHHDHHSVSGYADDPEASLDDMYSPSAFLVLSLFYSYVFHGLERRKNFKIFFTVIMTQSGYFEYTEL